MASINSIFINVQTSGIQDIPFDISTGWNNNGLPTINASLSGYLPEGVRLRTLVFPSGAGISETYFEHLIDPANYNELSTYINNSGFYYHNQYFQDSGLYNHTFNISLNHENTYYKFGYYVNYYDSDNNQPVYDVHTDIIDGRYLTKAAIPQPDNVGVTATIYSNEPTSSRLHMYITHGREITNHSLSSPAPYIITISGNNNYFDSSGNIIPSPISTGNYFYNSLSGMFINLPYLSGVQEDASVYSLSMYYSDQGGEFTIPLSFDTSSIKTSSDDFDDGVLSSFNDVSIKPVAEIPIKSDTVKKKRFSIGIEDLATVNESYVKQGVYISDFYTVDDPIYTFMLKVGETMPDIDGKTPADMVKYYVQFQNQDWIRISPISRTEEVDDDNNIVPKLFVLDRLNLDQISSDLSEVPYDFPVYSFRLRIEFDMSDLGSASFISPSVDYYECHVTDRSSFLRIE